MERLVDPYGLVAKAGVWYLVGGCGGETRVFRVARIRRATLHDHAAEQPADFDMAAYWTAWCRWFEQTRPAFPVTFRASSAGMLRVASVLGEQRWEALEQPGDGENWTTVSTIFGSLEQAHAAMLGLGPHVEVLEPLDLRRSVTETAQQIAALYGEQALPKNTASGRK